MELRYVDLRDDDRPGMHLSPLHPIGRLLVVAHSIIPNNNMQPPFYCDDVQLMYSKIMNEKLNPPKRIGEV